MQTHSVEWGNRAGSCVPDRYQMKLASWCSKMNAVLTSGIRSLGPLAGLHGTRKCSVIIVRLQLLARAREPNMWRMSVTLSHHDQTILYSGPK